MDDTRITLEPRKRSGQPCIRGLRITVWDVLGWMAAGKTEGQGVIDVTADEKRGLIYVVTCEEQHWMLYDMKTKRYRELGPILRDQPNTLIDAQGRGTAITADYRVARYDPAKNRVAKAQPDGYPEGYP